MNENANTENILDDAQRGRYLAFFVGNEAFGIEILYVTEIIGLQTITAIPEMPDYVKGIINLRGRIIPLIDVRLRFGKEPKEYDDRTCVIVVGVNGFSYGFIVDSVYEVMSIPDEDIVPLPEIQSASGNRFVKNIGKTATGIILVVDCEKLLTSEDIGDIEDKTQTTAE